jgi:hexulose-6-phosphate isomerase
MDQHSHPSSRRHFLGTATASLAAASLFAPSSAAGASQAAAATADPIVRPPAGKPLLLACKLGMIDKEANGKPLSLAQRLRMAADAGFDGVDFDQAGEWTEAQARAAVKESGVFVHNAINHAHWKLRLTSATESERAQGRANIEHCLRVSHAAGGSGVLIVIGQGSDGPADVIEERARQEIRAMLPLAASLGQMILIENVWNRMMYDHDGAPDQGPYHFIRFVDSFQSPWVGMYYDIGNHWKYAQPGEWIRAFGHRCVKLDIKGFSRKTGKFVDITSPDDDLPWDQVRKALADIGYHGWATAEVGGGDVARLTTVRQQMQKAFAL